jgi:signal transduction histidine kinase/Flp pilus assembly protein TadD
MNTYRNHWILLFLCSLHAFGVCAQSVPRLDSLEQILTQQEGEDRIVTLNQLVYEYGLLNLESAKKYADEAYNLSLKMDNDTLRVESMIYYGNALTTAARYEEAFDILNKAVARSDIKGYKKQLADAYNQIARAFYFRDELPQAWDYFNKAAQIRMELGDEQQIAASYNNYALIEIRQGNLEDARYYLEKAFKTYLSAGNKERAASIQNNLASLYMGQQDYGQALQYLQESRDIFHAIGKLYELAAVEQNLGIAYAELGRFEEALKAAEESLKLRRIQDNPDRLVSSLNTLGSILYQKGDFPKSLDVLEEAQLLITDINAPELCYEVTYNLSQTQKALGLTELAFGTLSKALILKDSLDLFNKEKAINELKARVEIEQYQKDIASLVATSESQQKSIFWLSILLLLIFFFLLSLGVIGIRLKNSKDRVTRLNQELIGSYGLIEKQNKQLSVLGKEKDYFLQIVAHDIGNQLANIHGLLQLTRMDNEGKREAGGASLQYLDRLQHITNNLILMVRKVLDVRNLEQAVLTLDPIEFDAVEVIGDVVFSYNERAAEKDIALHLHPSENRIKMVTDKQFLAQSVDNLVSNALKFSPRGKKVDVFLKRDSDRLIIEVCDEGPGIPPEEKNKLFLKYQRLSVTPTGNESSTGLGLSIVKRYAELMGGKVEHHNLDRAGCLFRLEIPTRLSIPTSQMA